MEIRLLGPVELWGERGPVDLGTPRQRCVFAALALTPRQAVGLDALVDRVWGEQLPADARAVLYTYVSRLRALLRQAGEERVALLRRGGGYLLDVDPDGVDLHRARRLAAQARRLAQEPGGDDQAAELLAQACALWTSTPLAGLPGDWAERVRTGLRHEHLALQTERFDAALRTGAHHAVVGPLSSALAAEPLAEPLAGLLMLALHRAGRHAEALDVYAQIRRRLAEEIGSEPGEALRHLHQRILRRDPALERAGQGPPGRAGAGGGSRWRSLCQLPPDDPNLVGREKQVKELVAALRPEPGGTALPLATVAGPPGVGKTALATHVAHGAGERFPDGRWYVRLGGTGARRDPAGVLAELLEASGLDSGELPAGLDRRAAVLRARLAGRRVLLLLDDAADAAQVRPLLPGAPPCAVLVTSRSLLPDLSATATVRLAPLGDTDAIELLSRLTGTDRAAAEPDATAKVADACGGLPLALRIAAARLAIHPEWTVERLADRLAERRRRLDELAVGDLDVRAGLELSYQALDEHEQAALRHLGLLGTGAVAAWTLGALAGADGERLAEALLTASLLAGAGADATGEPRYRLHDLVAAYAADLADREPPDATHAALRRHLRALLTLAEHAYRRLHVDTDDLPPAAHPVEGGLPAAEAVRLTRDPVAWLIAERGQLVDAITRACELGWHREAAALADRVLLHVLRVDVGSDGIRRLYARIRDAARDAGDELVAWRAMARLCTEAAVAGRIAEAADGLTGCAAAFERLDAPAELAFSLAEAVKYRRILGGGEELLRLAERAADVARRCGGQAELAAVRNLAGVLAASGRYQEAQALFDRTLELATAQDLTGHRTVAWLALAVAAYANSDLDRAERAWQRATTLVDGTTDPRGVAYLGWLAARLALARGRPDAAVRAAEDAAAHFADLGDARGQALAAQAAGEAHLAGDDPAAAAPLLEHAAQLLERTGQHAAHATVLTTLAHTYDALGESDRSAAVRRRAQAVPSATR